MAGKLKTTYQEQIVPKLMDQFGYTNIHQVPKLVKVTINRGLGEASQNAKALEASVNEVGVITGQKPVVTRAKKAIAGFKIREGMPVGVMVTLRGDRMYSFLERLINLALPRIRDFRGISPRVSMAVAITLWVCESNSSSQKLATTASTRFAGWIFQSLQLQTLTRRAAPY